MRSTLMNFVCPVCRVELQERLPISYGCPSCRKDYPLVAGIPDFRLFDPPYVSLGEEARRVNKLMEHYCDLDWESLTRFLVYELGDNIPEWRKESELKHRLTLRDRAKQRKIQLGAQLQELGYEVLAGSVVLDLGCGSYLFERKPNSNSDRLAGKVYHRMAPASVRAYTSIAEEHLIFAEPMFDDGMS